MKIKPTQQTSRATHWQTFLMSLQQDSPVVQAEIPAVQLAAGRNLEQAFSDTESLCSASQDDAPALDDLKAFKASAPSGGSWSTAMASCSEAIAKLPAQLRHCTAVTADAASSLRHDVILKPTAEVYALLAIPLVIWWFAVLSGAWAYEGLPKGQKANHCMLWFDRGIFAPAGAALPFLVIVLRVAAHAVHHGLKHGAASIPAALKAVVTQAAARNSRRRRLKLGTLVDLCLMLYVVVAVVRAVVYLLHWTLLSNRCVVWSHRHSLARSLHAGSSACQVTAAAA
eukprot:GHUV01020777.1.p1 GENE.GHUV01020777.1~~GHUV01020777.1.p1  ORF type:complete len:284 (+),score=100.63 GHUV01020777.1:208-1059(+)